jgi:hypothetical protein
MRSAWNSRMFGTLGGCGTLGNCLSTLVQIMSKSKVALLLWPRAPTLTEGFTLNAR